MKKPFETFTKKDYEILTILWNSEEPLSYHEIVEKGNGINVNTVQAQIRKLLKKEVIYVADIVYSGTVLCRKYLPKMKEDEFAAKYFAKEFSEVEVKPSTSSLVCALLDMESNGEKKKEEIKELEKMLREYKKCIEA